MHLDDPKYTTEQHLKLTAFAKEFYEKMGQPVKPERAVWERRLKLIEENLTEGECWWLVNMKSAEVTWSCGIEEALGYSHKITLFDTVNWIHGKYRDLFLEYNTHVTRVILEMLRDKLQHMKQRYVVEMPIRHRNGHYVQVTRTTFPFQFDAQNNWVSHIHRMFINTNRNEPIFDISLMDVNSIRREDLEAEVRKRVLTMAALPFSPRQMEILECYAYGKAEKAEQVAAILGIEVSTVYTHQKNILNLAKDNTGLKFPEIKDVAEYYRSKRLI